MSISLVPRLKPDILGNWRDVAGLFLGGRHEPPPHRPNPRLGMITADGMATAARRLIDVQRITRDL